MRKQAMSNTSARQTAGERQSLLLWWRQTGEPVVVTGLVLAGFTLPVLVFTGLLSLQNGVRGMLFLIWLAGGLLLTRLPRLLCQEKYRAATLAAVGLAGLAFALFARPVATILAEPFYGPPLSNAATAPAQQAELTFKSPPRISKELFVQLLQRGVGGGPSPAAPHAGELYDIIVSYELDPAVALAFFAQESQFCTTGICSSHDMKSWGGQRAAFKRERAAGIVRGKYGPFVAFHTWQDSVRDWCELILYRYVGRGLDTVEKAIPVYAPAADNNNPPVYINNVRRRVAVWQGRDPGPPAIVPARTYDEDLETALVKELFLANDQEYYPTWAFHKYVLDQARAGRPLGSPLDESRHIMVNGRLYAIQAFANDILYTPVADVVSETNWGDVRRLSDLLQQGQPQAQPPAEQPSPQPTVQIIQQSSPASSE